MGPAWWPSSQAGSAGDALGICFPEHCRALAPCQVSVWGYECV